MKIALLTYHYGYNEGTLLQAYAVQSLMDHQFGTGTATIIDHRYPAKEKIVFNPPADEREKALRRFFDTRLRLSTFKNTGDDPGPTWKHVSENYDLVLVGSDELWRLDYTVVRRFLLPVRKQLNAWAPPFPNVYWPDAEELGVPCASIAASLSEKDRPQDVPREHRQKMARILSGLSPLTVRDSRTQAFVEGVVGSGKADCQWLPDPTFMLPPSDAATLDATREALRQAGVDTDKKLALIISHTAPPALTRGIKSLKAKGYEVLCVTKMHAGADHDLSAAPLGPLEWAALSALTKVVVTDRFHGAVFALKNNVPVIALDYRDQLSGNDSKMLDLFKRFGVEQNWMSVRSGDTTHLESRLDEIVSGAWPKERIARIAGEFREALFAFAAGPLAGAVKAPAAVPR